MKVSYGCRLGITSRIGGGGWMHKEKSPTLCADINDNSPPVVIIYHHPQASDLRIAEDQSNIQTLTQTMGMGGQHPPDPGKGERQ